MPCLSRLLSFCAFNEKKFHLEFEQQSVGVVGCSFKISFHLWIIYKLRLSVSLHRYQFFTKNFGKFSKLNLKKSKVIANSKTAEIKVFGVKILFIILKFSKFEIHNQFFIQEYELKFIAVVLQ